MLKGNLALPPIVLCQMMERWIYLGELLLYFILKQRLDHGEKLLCKTHHVYNFKEKFQETLSHVFAKSSFKKIKSCLDLLAHVSTKHCLKCTLVVKMLFDLHQ